MKKWTLDFDMFQMESILSVHDDRSILGASRAADAVNQGDVTSGVTCVNEPATFQGNNSVILLITQMCDC